MIRSFGPNFYSLNQQPNLFIELFINQSISSYINYKHHKIHKLVKVITHFIYRIFIN